VFDFDFFCKGKRRTWRDASCRRELELENSAEEISKASEKKVARNLAMMGARAGFRGPGKAPISLIKRPLRRKEERYQSESAAETLAGREGDR